VRQIIIQGNGRERPAFLITSDIATLSNFCLATTPGAGGSNMIAEAVKFIHFNALSLPILIKDHSDVIMTMITDTLYSRLASQMHGFEECDTPKIYRNFVKGGATVEVRDGNFNVKFAKRAHNPVLRSVNLSDLPQKMPWLDGAKVSFTFNWQW
jgi:hypothetical protein